LKDTLSDGVCFDPRCRRRGKCDTYGLTFPLETSKDITLNHRLDQALILYSPDLDHLDPPKHVLVPRAECRPLRVSRATPKRDIPTLYLISVAFWLEQGEKQRRTLLRAMRNTYVTTILVGERAQRAPEDLFVDGVFAACLEQPVHEAQLEIAIAMGLRSAVLGLRLHESRTAERDRSQEMADLHRIGMALASEQDLNTLEQLILRTSRDVTHADAGTLYVVEQNDGGESLLRFGVAQNASLPGADYEHHVLALDRHSLAGYVACTGEVLMLEDVYHLPDGAEYEFNPAFDREFGYRTRSMMVAPMVNNEGEVVGVIQLVNRKRSSRAALKNPESGVGIESFMRRDKSMLVLLAGQAAVALENRMLLETNRLYKELQKAYGQLEDYLREVSKVITAASEVETGTFRPEALADVAERNDALGHLGRVFVSMAREVRAREERLQRQVAAQRIEIDEARQAREVAEITESDFFVGLQEKARALREKR
jgi:GAF domain-containing protein